MAAVTIADLIRDRQLLRIYCRECGRELDLDPSTLRCLATIPFRTWATACGHAVLGVRLAQDPHRAPSSTPEASIRTKWGGSREQANKPRGAEPAELSPIVRTRPRA